MPSKSIKSLRHNDNTHLEFNTGLDHRSHRSKAGRKPVARHSIGLKLYKDKLNKLKEQEFNEEIII